MDNERVLLARQPIYNETKVVVGYELLFRPAEGESFASVGGSVATSRVLLNAFNDNEINSITNGLPAFVNFTEDLIHTAPSFNPAQLIIEILEDIPVTPELINDIKHLKKQGFKIALDDYTPDPALQPLLELADIVKLELPALPKATLQSTIANLKPYGLILLAEKIEDNETFEYCKALGCKLFQGFFLAKPVIVKGRNMPQNKMAILRLLGNVQNPNVEIKQLVEVIKQDPLLSFKLLKQINSAVNYRSKKIETIHMAVVMLGLAKIKSWATLLALSSVDDKPIALKQLALQRARFCELVAERIAPQQTDLYFTAGLLSCLDAFLDQPLTDIVLALPLDEKLSLALINYEGEAGLVLKSLLYYEKSLWEKINWQAFKQYQIDKNEVCQIYLSSINWANDFKEV